MQFLQRLAGPVVADANVGGVGADAGAYAVLALGGGDGGAVAAAAASSYQTLGLINAAAADAADATVDCGDRNCCY